MVLGEGAAPTSAWLPWPLCDTVIPTVTPQTGPCPGTLPYHTAQTDPLGSPQSTQPSTGTVSHPARPRTGEAGGGRREHTGRAHSTIQAQLSAAGSLL